MSDSTASGFGVALHDGTAGVGLETACQFAEQGARVVLQGRNLERGAAPSLIGDTPGAGLINSDPFSAKLFEKAAAMAHLGVVPSAGLASMALYLASPPARRITGQTISINGGISVG